MAPRRQAPLREKSPVLTPAVERDLLKRELERVRTLVRNACKEQVDNGGLCLDGVNDFLRSIEAEELYGSHRATVTVEFELVGVKIVDDGQVSTDHDVIETILTDQVDELIAVIDPSRFGWAVDDFSIQVGQIQSEEEG